MFALPTENRDTVLLFALKKHPKEKKKKTTNKSIECFSCGEEGHWANKCPNKLKKVIATHVTKKDILPKTVLITTLAQKKNKKPK